MKTLITKQNTTLKPKSKKKISWVKVLLVSPSPHIYSLRWLGEGDCKCVIRDHKLGQQ